MSGEVFYGRTVRRSEGSWMAKGIVGWRTADIWKFLLFFRNTQLAMLFSFKIGSNKLNVTSLFYDGTPRGVNLFDHLLWPIFQSSITHYNFILRVPFSTNQSLYKDHKCHPPAISTVFPIRSPIDRSHISTLYESETLHGFSNYLLIIVTSK